MLQARHCMRIVVRHHYHDFHPNTGVHLMKVGKIQLYTEQFDSAEKSLRQVSQLRGEMASSLTSVYYYKTLHYFSCILIWRF